MKFNVLFICYLVYISKCVCVIYFTGLRIKETKEVYEGEVTELTPVETENPMGGELKKLIKEFVAYINSSCQCRFEEYFDK